MVDKQEGRKIAEDSILCSAEAKQGNGFDQDKYRRCMQGRGHGELFEK